MADEGEDDVAADSPEGKLKRVTEDLEDLNAMLKERDTMLCLQARCAVEGHKLGVTGIAWRFVDEKNAQVLTTGQDQCCKLYDVPIPDPKLFRRWALDTGGKSGVNSRSTSKDSEIVQRKSKQYVHAGDS